MQGFQVFAKDVKMEMVIGKVLIEVPIYAHPSRSKYLLVDWEGWVDSAGTRLLLLIICCYISTFALMPRLVHIMAFWPATNNDSMTLGIWDTRLVFEVILTSPAMLSDSNSSTYLHKYICMHCRAETSRLPTRLITSQETWDTERISCTVEVLFVYYTTYLYTYSLSLTEPLRTVEWIPEVAVRHCLRQVAGAPSTRPKYVNLSADELSQAYI